MKTRLVWFPFIARLVVLLVSAGVADAAPVPGAFADVSVTWHIFSDSNSASGPLVASPPDAVVLDPSNVEGAQARANASVIPDATGKLLRSSSFVTEAGPDFSTSMAATSTARIVTQWMVTSDGSVVSPGSLVNIDTLLSFEGRLSAFNGAPFARMSATMNVYTGDVMTTVFQGTGLLESNSQTAVLTDGGGFAGQFTRGSASCSPSARIACLNFNQDFPELFSVVEGETFWVELILLTHAQGVIANGEAQATADFYNSGGFNLSTGGVGGLLLSQTVVPVPAAVWLFGSALGLMGVIRRKLSS